MDGLIKHDSFGDFASAAAYARRLAMEHQSPTGVQRSSDEWVVFISRYIRAELDPGSGYSDDPYFPYNEVHDPYYDRDDEYHDDALELLMDEIHGGQDDWARSEDEGWFYNDYNE